MQKHQPEMPDELRMLEERLRHARAGFSSAELDRFKRRVLASSGAREGRLTLMRSRIVAAVTTLVLFGAVGGAVALSSSLDSHPNTNGGAAASQYHHHHGCGKGKGKGKGNGNGKHKGPKNCKPKHRGKGVHGTHGGHHYGQAGKGMHGGRAGHHYGKGHHKGSHHKGGHKNGHHHKGGHHKHGPSHGPRRTRGFTG
jgi:hypothetical protein